MSLFSTGAINGNAINVEAIDGGHFRFEASASAGVVAGAALAGVRRAVAQVAVGVTIAPAAKGCRRLVGHAAAGAVLGCAARSARRTAGAGAAAVSVTVAALGIRRTRIYAAASVAIDGTARLNYRTLRRAPLAHTTVVPAELRLMVVPPEPVTEPVRPEIPFVVPRETRSR